MKPKEPSKQIVSKRDYAILLGKREALRWGSVGMAVVVAVCLLCTVGFIMVGLEAGAVAWKHETRKIRLGARLDSAPFRHQP